jgi:lysozyme
MRFTKKQIEEQIAKKLSNVAKGVAVGLALSPMAYMGGNYAGHALRGAVDPIRSPTSSQASPAPIQKKTETKTETKTPQFKDLAHGMIRHFEAFREKAYPDKLTKSKIPTIGWGMTKHPDGRAVKLGDTVSREDADKHLESHTEGLRSHLESTIPHWSDMQPHQHAALSSFAHNLGKNFYTQSGSNFASIRKALKERDWDNVPTAMALYNKSGGRVQPGLVRRRQAEGAMWQGRVSGFNEKGEPVIQDENK